MANERRHLDEPVEGLFAQIRSRLPRPSPQFRRRSWAVFQRALDPLAPPKPLRSQRQR